MDDSSNLEGYQIGIVEDTQQGAQNLHLERTADPAAASTHLLLSVVQLPKRNTPRRRNTPEGKCFRRDFLESGGDHSARSRAAESSVYEKSPE